MGLHVQGESLSHIKQNHEAKTGPLKTTIVAIIQYMRKPRFFLSFMFSRDPNIKNHENSINYLSLVAPKMRLANRTELSWQKPSKLGKHARVCGPRLKKSWGRQEFSIALVGDKRWFNFQAILMEVVREI